MRRLALALLLLPAIAVFAPGLRYPFLGLDDVHHVVENPAIRDLSWQGLRFLFFEDTRDARYFPLSYLSLAFDYRLFGLEPLGYHLHNLALHLANTLLVAALVRRLTRDEIAAWVTALLFSIHPLQVESVAWIISRKNVLFLFFFLLAALAYLRFAEREGGPRRWAWLAASSLLYLLACLAKTTAITLPAVLVLIDACRAPNARLGPLLWRSLPSKLAYVPPALAVALATQMASRHNPFQTHYAFSALEWLTIAGHNLFFYVARTLAPLRLGVYYPLPAPGELPPHFGPYALLGGALVLAAIASWWRARTAVLLGLGWYLITIFPLAILVVVFSDLPLLVADRYFYQSSIGLFLLAGAGASALWRHRSAWRPALAGAGALAAVVLFGQASAQRATYRSTIALYEHLLANHPSTEFYYRLALEYHAAGRRDDAYRALEAADRAPHRVFFLRFFYYQSLLADLYRRKGDFAAAADHLAAGIEATPNVLEPHGAGSPLAWLYVAELRERAGDAEGAAAARARAETAQPDPEQQFEHALLRAAPDEAARFLGRHLR